MCVLWMWVYTGQCSNILLFAQTRYKETQKLQKHRDAEATKAENKLSDEAFKKLSGMQTDHNMCRPKMSPLNLVLWLGFLVARVQFPEWEFFLF